jgi:hypothetical protein
MIVFAVRLRPVRPPDVIFLTDRDGDSKADVQEQWFASPQGAFAVSLTR